MPRNGAGTYSLPAGNPPVSGTDITVNWADTTLTDVGAELTNSVAKDGQTTMTGNLKMGTKLINNVGAPTATTDAARLLEVQGSKGQNLGSISGTDTITAVASPNITAYAASQQFVFIPAATNTGATTINIDGVGAKNIFHRGAACVGGELQIGIPTVIYYDGTQFQILGPSYPVGKFATWVPAAAMTPRTTNGAASGVTELATNDVMLNTLDYDQTTSEGAQFQIAMPKSWNEGTVTFIPYWTAASGSGTVIWSLRGLATSNDDAMDAAFGTPQTSTDTLLAANDCHIGPESAAITIGGTPAENDLVIFEVSRDISDTLSADAKLIGINLFITYNAPSDA